MCTTFISCFSILFGNIFCTKIPNNNYLEVFYTLNFQNTSWKSSKKKRFPNRPILRRSGDVFMRSVVKVNQVKQGVNTGQRIAPDQALKYKVKVKQKFISFCKAVWAYHFITYYIIALYSYFYPVSILSLRFKPHTNLFIKVERIFFSAFIVNPM